MLLEDFIPETAAIELAKKLPSLAKHDYQTIDKLMQKIAKKHQITGSALHKIFVKKYKKTPDSWIKNKLNEKTFQADSKLNIQDEVNKFVDWAAERLKLENIPKVQLSKDTEEAQVNHHTGGHVPGSDVIWVYAKNRNLVDILRTVVHELTHVRQHELNMIKPNDSYPGSPIEAQADMVAGKLMKIYGKENNHIFQ
jgi:hypothetical protein